MKKILCAVFALTTLISLTACSKKAEDVEKDKLALIKEQGYIMMATSPDFGPYEFLDLSKEGSDSIVGCDIELGKYIADYLGVELKIEPMDFDACQAAVSSGKVDFSISGYAKTPEREENMECSDMFLWKKSEDNQGIIVLKENADELSDLKSFEGKTIGAQNASLQMNLATSQLPNSKVEVISSMNDGVMMLLGGKIDALASSYDTGEQFCKNYSELTMSKFVFEATLEDGNVILATKGETALMAEINKAIAKAKEEGKFSEWLTESTELCNTLSIQAS